MPKSVKDFVEEALQTVKEASPEEAHALAQSGEYLLLDVREPEEFAAGHMNGAINVPRGQLEVQADLEHPKRNMQLQDRGQKILCYCAGGVRSAMACKTLQEMGFTDTTSMREGWTGWEKRGLPSER
jgi:rhodanese-related sulfurtransferase